MKYSDQRGFSLSAMTIGTVQLGMNYGIANDAGQPDEAKSFAMLRAAFENGITSLDTAAAYGNSEEVIGSWMSGIPADKAPLVATKCNATSETL